jgi:ABC-type antimicrobial peptide transport system permease subunit
LQHALRGPPYDVLQLSSQHDLERTLASDPLAHGIELSLLAAAVLALALATFGLWATASSDLRDERGEYFDLEAQGVPPAVLRRQLWLRSFVVLALGAAGGLGVGLLVSRIVVYLVRTSAAATLPEPPLLSVTAWTLAAVALAVVAVAAAAGVALAAGAAFRADVPERSAWSLE